MKELKQGTAQDCFLQPHIATVAFKLPNEQISLQLANILKE